VTKNAQEEIRTLDITSYSSTQTQHLGMCLGNLLRGGELILLEGRLGTGKTTFTQGLAQGLGINDVINSPTFTLLKEYKGQPRFAPEAPARATRQVGLTLYHFDLYRLDDPEEIIDLGFEDYFYSSGVCVIEWADKAEEFWPAEQLCVQIKMMSETKRELLFMATGTRYCELLKQFQEQIYVTVSS
jgi:tRNA threonylcarbamoyladenosine biosynthesis protein TsaE